MKIQNMTSMSSRRIRLVCVLLAIAVVGGCPKSNNDTPSPLSPEQAEQVTRVMIDWLECEECLAGELERVVANATHLQPMLMTALERGPSPSSRELLRIELERRYDRIREYGRTHPEVELASSREEFVKLYLDNFEALYQSRAAIALGAIGGDESRRVLKAALESDVREDVGREIRETLTRMK